MTTTTKCQNCGLSIREVPMAISNPAAGTRWVTALGGVQQFCAADDDGYVWHDPKRGES